jgi:hypothetical protein
MDRASTSLTSADFSILLFSLPVLGVAVAFALAFYALMSPTVLKNIPEPSYTSLQTAIVLSPEAHLARVKREDAAIVRAKEMNAEVNTEPTRVAGSLVETSTKHRKARVARAPTSRGRAPAQPYNAFSQGSYASFQW